MAARIQPRKKSPMGARLWKKVWKKGAMECWPWLGYRDKVGMPTFGVEIGHMEPARRTLWKLLHKVELTRHQWITSDCQKDCMNPDHLYMLTRAEAVRRRTEKRRMALREGKTVKGIRLTSIQAEKIKRCKGEVDIESLADRFKVSRNSINNIWRGRSWKLVEEMGFKPPPKPKWQYPARSV